jgi:hypothetical protein
MQPDEVEVLVLNLRSDHYSLPDFTKKKSKLEVLIITNYGLNHSELTKFKLLGFFIKLEKNKVGESFSPLPMHIEESAKIIPSYVQYKECF